MVNNDTFVKITNKDIYNKIIEMEKANNKQHEQMIMHQEHTNGKVKANTKFIWAIAGGALSLTGWFVFHLMNSAGG